MSVRLVSRKNTNTARGFTPEATRWFLKARYHHAGPVAGWKRNATISSWLDEISPRYSGSTRVPIIESPMNTQAGWP